ncbi:MAG: DUF2961 domain-containing protein [Pseudonocardiales bacterium]|nr:DUF2961 domain-containing protein [Pseudonocardiales bacterium]
MFRASRVLAAVLGVQAIGLLVTYAQTVPAAAVPASSAARARESAVFPGKGPVGWDVYRRLDELPALTSGVVTKQFSSFARSGGNDDFWSTPDQCQRVDHGKCVVAEHVGPGEIDAVWFTTDEGDVSSVGTITITLDGHRVVQAPLQDIVNGKLGAPFVYPLVSNREQSSGGVNIAVPMPFRSSMLITTESSSFYYHVTYRTFADADGVGTFDPADKATDVLAILGGAGKADPKPATGNARTAGATLNLAPGGSVVAGRAFGPGQLTAIRMRVPQAHYVRPRSVTDDGRAFGKGGSSAFTVAIDPHNSGVVLTRRLDPLVSNQVASVAVDGTVVGRWEPKGSLPRVSSGQWPAKSPAVLAATAEWAEESVILPAAVTAGKFRITITNAFVSSDLDVNEFTYWVDSRVNGNAERTDTVDVGDAVSEAKHGYRIVGQTWQGVRTYDYPLDAGQLAEISTARQLLQGLRLSIDFDGQTTVDSPVGEFFGSGFTVAPVRSLMFAMDASPGGWYTAWWPMPFVSGATVRLRNTSALAVTAAQIQITSVVDARVASGLAQRRIGYFRTSSHAGPTTPDQDWMYLSARGSGKFVGDTVDMIGPASRQYLEGDERVYLDGVHSPQIHGTGTEDYYESGWFFNRGPYSTALHGNSAHLTSRTGCAKDKDCTSAFRLMLAEAVPYGSRLEFGIEHGGADDASATYSSTAYYYGAAHNSLHQSDLLRVGDAGSKAQHHYSSPDPGPAQQLSATYEGVDGPQKTITSDLRNTTSPVTFTLKLDPSNAGAMLVRTSDQQQGYQSAQVAVNGVALPDWIQPLHNPDHRWLDDIYLLPASVTAGRASITVTLTPVSGAPPWSAAAYRLISVVGIVALFDRSPMEPLWWSGSPCLSEPSEDRRNT